MKALVTGASSGIGRDICRYLSQKGYDLILVARDELRLKKLQKEISTNSEIIIMDLTNKEKIFELYEQFKEQNIDILINDAGFRFVREI